jgi:3-hydroxyacyl-CoA dehydrogenase / enoyl-CoA hydratase / 3-hydroxybutyryl-CoA epimerase / enoyl-CoA isomerase
MAAGFPDRMKNEFRTAIDVMFDDGRYGQKTDKGFYTYELDRKGKQKKVKDESVYGMLKPVVQSNNEFTDEEIIERLMVPLCIETVRCLEDGIVDTAAEADMGLIFGIGFPPFRGGALRYIDSIGVEAFCEIADKYKDLGALYHPTAGMREMAKAGKKFFG